MQLGDTRTKRRHDRFDRFKIIFPILLAGWIPSILTLIVSYTILRDTLESRILRDRQTLIQLVGHLVGHDLNRSSAIINYYQTLPEVARILSAQLAMSYSFLSMLFFRSFSSSLPPISVLRPPPCSCLRGTLARRGVLW